MALRSSTPEPDPPPSDRDLDADLRHQRGRLLSLIRVNETLRTELKRQRNKLLTANQDQYFLFERLRNHEKCPALQPRQRREPAAALTPSQSEVVRVKRKYRKRKPKETGGTEVKPPVNVSDDAAARTDEASSVAQFSSAFSKSKQIPSLKRAYNTSSSRSLLLPTASQLLPAAVDDESSVSSATNAELTIETEEEELTIDEKTSSP